MPREESKDSAKESKDPGDLPADVRSLTFERALEDLEAIVRRLESGEVTLEESIATYTRGTQLKRHCEAKLEAAREQVERIELRGGTATAVPIQPD